MSKVLTVLFSLSFLVTGASCSTISKEECKVGDWAGIGREDGSQGRSKKRFYDYVEECGEYGVRPDHKSYKKGYAKGIKSYCTAENGWQEGRAGKIYQKVCPKKLAKSFQKGYRAGRRAYKMTEQIGELTSEIEKTESQIMDREKQIVAKGKTGGEVAVELMHINKLRDKKNRLESKRRKLEARVTKLDANAHSAYD